MSVRSATYFALVSNSGLAHANSASSALGVRPFFFVAEDASQTAIPAIDEEYLID